MEMFEHFRLVADPGQAPLRIDKFMAGHLEGTSRSRVQAAIRSGYVEVNGGPAKANMVIKAGDVIVFKMPYPKRNTEIVPQEIPLDIVYEDDDVIVINKPAGMVVHPGNGHFEGTLVNALAHYLGISTEDERLGLLVHRIDMDTSGLLVVAKNEKSQTDLAGQFFVHSIERKYNAVVWGNIAEDAGTVDLNIARDPSDRLKFRAYRPESGIGKNAVTHFRVLERFGYVTLVECELETGRTHQIRVHMAALGHPLFNDSRYGGSDIRKGTIYNKYRQFIKNCFELCPRQALHARTLGFRHPSTGEVVRFEVPLPADMTALLERWRKYASNMPAEE